MDESWRMQMGMSTSAKPLSSPRSSLPRRRSTEETPSRNSGSERLDPEDFSDVFGGPPRSVIRRQFSGDAELFKPAASSSFYEEIFRIPETVRSGLGTNNSRRRLPEFMIPISNRRIDRRSEDGFYGDIFGKEIDELRRSRSRSLSKSKSNCSSVISYEDLNPDDDAAASFSIFASKLRPINVPSRWNSTARIPEDVYYPSFYNHQIEQGLYTDSFRSLRNSIPRRRVTSPELNSPSSVVSSQFQDFDHTTKTEEFANDQPFQEQDDDDDDDDEDEDEIMSSYVIEINSDHHREGTEEAIAIDEAIAWAKERFQSASPNRNTNMEEHDKNQSRTATSNGLSDSNLLLSPEREFQVLDNDIKEWSAGKETNIRQLLSTLHHILWENSGWQEISIANLMENSNVKKGYQKARLCLHPDKVQQRGSTFIQKYIAEKTFAILQEAWDTFISQDLVFS